MFKHWSHKALYKAYFLARAKYSYGQFLHVTITPKGTGVSHEELRTRVSVELFKVKAIDWGIFAPETDNTNHYHGIIHVKNNSKLLKLRRSDLISFLDKEGSPEGWIRYCTKHNPRVLYKYKGTSKLFSIRSKYIDNYLE